MILKEQRKKREILKDEKKHHGPVDKSSSERHFVNQMHLPLLCAKSGNILLVLVGLTVGRQSNKILVDFGILYGSHWYDFHGV